MEKQAPHGMRIVIKDEEGKTDRIYMASVAKCPDLAKKIAEISKLERTMTIEARKGIKLATEADELQTVIDDPEASPEQKRKAIASQMECMDKGAAIADKQRENEEKFAPLVADFYRTAFLEAGYTPDQVERNMGLVQLEDYERICAILRTGCGFADFTKRGQS